MVADRKKVAFHHIQIGACNRSHITVDLFVHHQTIITRRTKTPRIWIYDIDQKISPTVKRNLKINWWNCVYFYLENHLLRQRQIQLSYLSTHNFGCFTPFQGFQKLIELFCSLCSPHLVLSFKNKTKCKTCLVPTFTWMQNTD